MGEFRKQVKDLEGEKQVLSRNLQRAEGRGEKEVAKASKWQQQFEDMKAEFQTTQKVGCGGFSSSPAKNIP